MEKGTRRMWLFLFSAIVGILRSVSAELTSYECPYGWAGYLDHCYRFAADTAVDRVTAKTECTRDGAYLLSVNDEMENNFVIGQLETNDHGQIKKTWWSSGLRKEAGKQEFFWEGDGTSIESFYFWINSSIPGQENLDHILYYFDGYKWGWVLDTARPSRPFVCEISKEDLFMIGEISRGPDYGVTNPDETTIERGPMLTVQPTDTVYETEDSVGFAYIDCRASAYPAAGYTWVREKDGVQVELDPGKEARYTVTNGRLVITKPNSAADDGLYQCKAHNQIGLVLSNTAKLTAGYLLDFPKSPRSPIETTSYQWASIECSPPSHYPEVLYTWYKNDIYNFIRPEVKPYIMISNDGRLYFSEVTSDDAGDYYCLIYKPGQATSQGKVSMPTQLKVTEGSPGTYEPQIGDGFPSVYPTIPKVGHTLRIECWASGSYRTGELIYNWDKVELKDGKVVRVLPLPNQAKVTDHNRVLNIPDVTFYDEGTYRCTVRRVNGQSTSKTINIVLQAVPYFTVGLKDQFIDAGTTLQWRCEAGGPPNPSYRWLKNGAAFDNTTIPADDVSRVSVSNNWVTIKALDAEKDNAMYQCVATNALGTRYSSAQLKVLSFAPNFAKYPLQPNQYATEKGNTSLLCRPEAAPYPAFEEIVWYKDGTPLNPSAEEQARVRKMPNGNLFIFNVQSSDVGTYRCHVTNALGSAYTEGNLTVLTTTTISQPPIDTNVMINSSTLMQCMASYDHRIDVTYVWHHGNVLVEFERVFRLGENRYEVWLNPHYKRGTGMFAGGLYIMNAQYEHSGRYRCSVESSTGGISKAANLYVFGPPSEPAGVYINSVTVTASSVVVQWKASGNNGRPISSYVVETNNHWEGYWIIHMTNVVAQPDEYGTMHVQVPNLRPFSNYTVRMRAENIIGTSVASTPSDQFTTAATKPDMFPELVGGGGGKAGELTITWTPLPAWQHNGPDIGYRILVKTKGNEDWEYVANETGNVGHHVKLVGEQNFYLEYEVTVQAFNRIGLGPLAPIVVIRSAMGLPTIVAQNVLAQPLNATACIVHWEPVDDNRDNLKGKLGGYRVSFWRECCEVELGAQRVTVDGQAAEGTVIGLYPNTPYYFDVMVWNEAGNGPKSQYFIQRTLRNAPLNMPVEVEVNRRSESTIFVKWRGVSTNQLEEPLEGYKVRIWRDGEEIKVATDYDAKKETDLIVDGLRSDVVYKLRVFGYSRGGQGALSSPAIKFMLGSSPRTTISAICLAIGLFLSLSFNWRSSS